MVLNDEEIKDSMKSSINDAFFSAILFYLTSSFFGAFAIALGADNMFIGLLASIPLVFWTLAQLPAAKVVDKKGDRKMITVVALAISRLLIIPVILIPTLFIGNALVFLIVFVSLSSFFTAFSNPSWASWMADIVPSNIRGKFFSDRLRKYTIASIIALVFSSVVFAVFPRTEIIGFQIIFTVGVIAGLISTFYIHKMKDPGIVNVGGSPSSIRYFWKNITMRKFIITFFIWQFGMTLSIPFYVVRLVKYMGAGYEWVAIQLLVFSITMVAFQKLWGKYLDKFGSRVILSLCAIGSAFYPFFWLFVRVPYHIIPIEILSGIAWSGVNLAYFNYLLEISPGQKRHFYLALFYIVFGLAGVLGPIVGGLIASAFETETFIIFVGLEAVFFISWIVRLIGAGLFMKYLDEIPLRQRVKTSYVFGELLKYGQKKAITSVYLTRTRSTSTLKKTYKKGYSGVRKSAVKFNNTRKKIKVKRPKHLREPAPWV